ncbi:PREDICTED: tripartite motif-containing protein 2-like [Branchiostoma belcheri]|uniref:Tripartite motif-containing protein 2-like n=1 Tax=Branchiostoma belcheri TaxID=7741 RepID=A0A6P4YXM8_BRABE|nr:PREDICTED: tripartite motif-containing protein 2-like [Branchiostoma belcheri]
MQPTGKEFSSSIDGSNMAAAREAVSLQTKLTDDFLVCAICMDTFVRPKVLPCQHRFCAACLTSYAAGRSQFPCPLCQQWVDLPWGGVDALPVDFLVNSLVEAVRESEDAESRKGCDVHGEAVSLYCQDCEAAVCPTCLVEDHNGHTMAKLTEVAEQKRAKLKASLSSIQEECQEWKASGEKYWNEIQAGLTAEKDHAARDINAAARRIIEQVTHDKEARLRELHTTFTSLSDAVEKKKHQFLNSSKQREKTLDSIADDISKGHVVDLVRQEEEVYSKINQQKREGFPTLPWSNPKPSIRFQPFPPHPNTTMVGYLFSMNPWLQNQQPFDYSQHQHQPRFPTNPLNVSSANVLPVPGPSFADPFSGSQSLFYSGQPHQPFHAFQEQYGAGGSRSAFVQYPTTQSH